MIEITVTILGGVYMLVQIAEKLDVLDDIKDKLGLKKKKDSDSDNENEKEEVDKDEK